MLLKNKCTNVWCKFYHPVRSCSYIQPRKFCKRWIKCSFSHSSNTQNLSHKRSYIYLHTSIPNKRSKFIINGKQAITVNNYSKIHGFSSVPTTILYRIKLRKANRKRIWQSNRKKTKSNMIIILYPNANDLLSTTSSLLQLIQKKQY